MSDTLGKGTYPHLRIDPQILRDIAADTTYGSLWTAATTNTEKKKVLGNFIHETHKLATINFFNGISTGGSPIDRGSLLYPFATDGIVINTIAGATSVLLSITSSNSFTVAENTTAVGALTANKAIASWSLGGADSALFQVNGNNLVFISAPDFESPGSATGTNAYALSITVTGSNGAIATQSITVTVTDVDNTISITSSNSFTVAENTTAVGALTANKAIASWSLGGADAAKFQTSGDNLVFISAPDFESPGSAAVSNTYTLTIAVTGSNGATATQSVTVNVTDVDDTISITSSNSFTVAENTTAVGALTADKAIVSWALSGADAAKFQTSGDNLVFISAPDFESPGSAAGTNVYALDITVTGSNSATATKSITVTVTDVDDTISITSGNFSVVEGATAVGTLIADKTIASWSLGGADSAKFQTSGDNLVFISAPDFESPGSAAGTNVYALDITVTGSNSATATKSITVTVTDDTSDNTISITSSNSFTVAENTTAVGALTADKTIASWSLGGADSAKFQTSGDNLVFLSAPDFESPGSAAGTNVYALDITVTGSNSATATQSVTVNVTDDTSDNPVVAKDLTLVQDGDVVKVNLNRDLSPDQMGSIRLGIDGLTGSETFAIPSRISNSGQYKGNYRTGTPAASANSFWDNASIPDIMTLQSSISGFDINVTNSGSGYSVATSDSWDNENSELAAEFITITGEGGSGLAIKGTINASGGVDFVVTNHGSGYTSAPSVTIIASYSGSGSAAEITLIPKRQIDIVQPYTIKPDEFPKSWGPPPNGWGWDRQSGFSALDSTSGAILEISGVPVGTTLTLNSNVSITNFANDIALGDSHATGRDTSNEINVTVDLDSIVMKALYPQTNVVLLESKSDQVTVVMPSTLPTGLDWMSVASGKTGAATPTVKFVSSLSVSQESALQTLEGVSFSEVSGSNKTEYECGGLTDRPLLQGNTYKLFSSGVTGLPQVQSFKLFLKLNGGSTAINTELAAHYDYVRILNIYLMSEPTQVTVIMPSTLPTGLDWMSVASGKTGSATPTVKFVSSLSDAQESALQTLEGVSFSEVSGSNKTEYECGGLTDRPLLQGNTYKLFSSGVTGLPQVQSFKLFLKLNGGSIAISTEVAAHKNYLNLFATGFSSGLVSKVKKRNTHVVKRAQVTTGLAYNTNNTSITASQQTTELFNDRDNARSFMFTAWDCTKNIEPTIALDAPTNSNLNKLVYCGSNDKTEQTTQLFTDRDNARSFMFTAWDCTKNIEPTIPLDIYVAQTTPTTITKTAGNLKVVFDGTDKYEVFLVPDSIGEIKNNQNVGSNTVFACTAFTYGTDYSNKMTNIATTAANTQASLSTTGNDNHLCNGANTSTVLLADVQTDWRQLHRVTWFKTEQTFAASTDYKIMQLKHNGTKLVGKLELYYGDGTNGDQKKYIVSFGDDDETVAISATTIANPPPFRKYYVDVVNNQYVFSDGDGSSFSAYTNPITIYKRATYIFELNDDITSHPFGIKEESAVTTSSTDLFKIQGGSTQTVQSVNFNNIIQNKGDKLLMFTTENYSGSANNIKYYCVNDASMEKSFTLNSQTTTAGYSALVDSDKHIEIGRNIRLEIEGEEIIL